MKLALVLTGYLSALVVIVLILRRGQQADEAARAFDDCARAVDETNQRDLGDENDTDLVAEGLGAIEPRFTDAELAEVVTRFPELSSKRAYSVALARARLKAPR